MALSIMQESPSSPLTRPPPQVGCHSSPHHLEAAATLGREQKKADKVPTYRWIEKVFINHHALH